MEYIVFFFFSSSGGIIFCSENKPANLLSEGVLQTENDVIYGNIVSKKRLEEPLTTSHIVVIFHPFLNSQSQLTIFAFRLRMTYPQDTKWKPLWLASQFWSQFPEEVLRLGRPLHRFPRLDWPMYHLTQVTNREAAVGAISQ